MHRKQFFYGFLCEMLYRMAIEMSETYKVLKYYYITTILTVLLTAGMCGFFIAKANSQFMLFG